MWRIIQRGFWSKYGTSVKSSTQVVTSCEECHKKAVDRRALVHSAATSGLNNDADSESSREERDTNDGTTGGPHCDWNEHMRYFRHDMWSSSGKPCYYIEAIGWGTAVVLGVQMTTICRRNHCRSYKQRGYCCGHGVSPLHDRVQFNKWFKSHVCYTAAILSRLFTPDTQRGVVKRILPASSASTVHTEDQATSPTVDSNSSQRTNEACDTELNEFQNELFDFIQNLHIPSTSHLSSTQVSSDSVADDWNKLVDSYARGIRYNSLALKHAWSGDYHAAAHVWLRASRSGFCDGRILFNLAVCYQNGLGITKDIAKAMVCYSKAAKLNHARSAYNLAVLHLKSSSSSVSDDQLLEATRLLEQAASLGLKEAQRELGVLLTESSQRDMERAVTMFAKAAEQQDAGAMYYLGICHERGLGTGRNEARAAVLYRNAASQRHPSALYNLAVFFEHGIGGIAQNKTEAVRLYRDAAAQGSSAAVERLNVLHQHQSANKEAEFSVLRSSSSSSLVLSSQPGPRRQSGDDTRPMTFSRFYRSVSSDSSASSDSAESADPDLWTGSRSSVPPQPSVFYLDQSLSGAQASAAEPTISSDTSAIGKPGQSASSAEFQNLLKVMFGRREGSSCVPEDDRPLRQGSLSSFVLPKGSFGGAVLPHVSSFG